MTMATQSEFTDQIDSLPPLSAVVTRLIEVTSQESVSADQVVEVLREDQAIAAKVLRVANSPFYGATKQITQLSRAVVRLGTTAIQNMVIGICVRGAMPSAVSEVPEYRILWKHALAVASASDLIARRVGFRPAEEAFVAGLLHDIGQMAMAVFQPELFRTSLHDQDRQVRFLSREKELFGIDHTEAGFRLLTQWQLPESLCLVAQEHHSPEISVNNPLAQLHAIVILGDTIAQIMGMGFDFQVGYSRRAETATKLLGLTDRYPLCILDELEQRVNEVTQLFAVLDDATSGNESVMSKSAVWISPDVTNDQYLGQLLLEHIGYEVKWIQPDRINPDLPNNKLVIVTSGQKENFELARQLAIDLSHKGHERIILLCDTETTGTRRNRNSETGVLSIPHLFTIFDLKWVEEQWEL